MSADLVARLRQPHMTVHMGAAVLAPANKSTMAEAADRIEVLEAERDTLAGIVRRLQTGWIVMGDITGDVWIGRDDTEEPLTRSERLVLDRIRDKETTDD